MNRHLIAALLFSVGSDSFARLEWTVTEVQTNVPMGKAEVVISFPYKNSGRSVVNISSPADCCGCKTIISEPICEPGGSGYVEVKCDLTGRYGVFRKKISIEVSEKKQDLVIKINNPAIVSLKPKTLKWDQGSSTGKHLRLTNNMSTPIAIQSVSVLPEVCKVSIEAIKSGYVYDLRFEEVDEEFIGLAFVTINILDSQEKIIPFKAYLQFRE